jgi:predicted transcriptional regulator
MVAPPQRILAMSTTSLKVPDELKTRLVAAARRQGVTTHAFMVEAIRSATAAAEDRARFMAEAQAARKQALASGTGFAADEVHAYIRARVAGKAARRPKAKPWRG